MTPQPSVDRGAKHTVEAALDPGSGTEAEVLPSLVDALDADVVTCSEVAPLSGRVRFRATGPAAALPPAAPPDLPGLLLQHPLVLHYARTDCRDPHAVADVLGRHEWRRTPVARMLHEALGVTDQMIIPLPAPPGEVRVWVAMRRSRPFDRRDHRVAAGLQQLLVRLDHVPDAEHGGPQPDARPTVMTAGSLTASELAVLRLLAEGHTAAAMAQRLRISPRTVSKHLEHAYRKLGVSDRLSAVLTATDRGLLLDAHRNPESATR